MPQFKLTASGESKSVKVAWNQESVTVPVSDGTATIEIPDGCDFIVKSGGQTQKFNSNGSPVTNGPFRLSGVAPEPPVKSVPPTKKEESTSPAHGVGSSTQTEKAGVADAPSASLSEVTEKQLGALQEMHDSAEKVGKKTAPKKPASKPKSGGKDG